MQDLLTIKSIQDMNAALSQQRTFTRKVFADLDMIGERVLPAEIPAGEELEYAAKLHAVEMRVLRRYAELPTLTEFKITPALRGIAYDGGTFGVAAFIGEVVLGSVRSIEPRFLRLHRFILLLLMKELDDPTSGDIDLVEPVARFMRKQLDTAMGTLGEEERRKLVHTMMRPLVQAMLLVLHEFEMVESPDEHGYILTSLGKRVLLHLVDTQKFIDTITSAHKRLNEDAAPAA